jgi:hypothetical protein
LSFPGFGVHPEAANFLSLFSSSMYKISLRLLALGESPSCLLTSSLRCLLALFPPSSIPYPLSCLDWDHTLLQPYWFFLLPLVQGSGSSHSPPSVIRTLMKNISSSATSISIHDSLGVLQPPHLQTTFTLPDSGSPLQMLHYMVRPLDV